MPTALDQPTAPAASARAVPRRRGVAAATGLLAANAWWGAIALATGAMTIGDTATARLPFASPVFAGFALAVIVGIPATAVTVLAWRGSPATDTATLLLGVVVTAWIAVELAVVRELSFLHPTIAGYGLALIAWGHHGRSPRRRPAPTPD